MWVEPNETFKVVDTTSDGVLILAGGLLLIRA
jgi:hypothetical protein